MSKESKQLESDLVEIINIYLDNDMPYVEVLGTIAVVNAGVLLKQQQGTEIDNSLDGEDE